MDQFLEFENPLQELQDKIEKMEAFSKENGIDMSAQIAELQKELKDKRSELFDKLSHEEKIDLIIPTNQKLDCI